MSGSNGLPSFYDAPPQTHTPGTPWTVLTPSTPDNPSGTFQNVPWSDTDPLSIFMLDQGGGNFDTTATTDPEVIAHKDRQLSTARNQALIKLAAMIGGGAALTGGFGGGAAAGATDALQPINVGSSYLPGGTVGFEGAGAAGAGGVGNLAGLPALGGAEGLTGVAVPSAGSYLPPVEGYSGADLGAAAMGPPSSLAGSGSWLSRLQQASKLAGQGGSGQQQQSAAAPAMAPRASGGGAFLRRVLQPRPNYLGQFGSAVMAGQQATDLISRARRP